MIDLTKPKTISSGFLQKLGIKRSSRTNSLIYELEISYSVDNMEQARTLDVIIGGTESAFRSNLDDSENKIFIKSNTNNCSWVLELLDDSNNSIISKMVDVTMMAFNTSHIGCFLTLKLRTLKGKSSDASLFASLLGDKIKTSFENPQQSLFSFQDSDEDEKPIQNIRLIGGIEAMTGESSVGIKISDDGSKVIIDDFGRNIIIMKNEVTTELAIENEGFIEFVSNYKQNVDSPTWRDIIPHIVLLVDPKSDTVSLSSLNVDSEAENLEEEHGMDNN